MTRINADFIFLYKRKKMATKVDINNLASQIKDISQEFDRVWRFL